MKLKYIGETDKVIPGIPGVLITGQEYDYDDLTAEGLIKSGLFREVKFKHKPPKQSEVKT